jgi:glycosyltransferase involved in cell wall biosynthesis
MISVLMPVRNCAEWIEEAVRSIVSQTLPPEEILVADDASSDGTPELLEALKLPGVRILRSEERRGISSQMNRLLAEAKGRFVARMDGDDIALPNKLSLQIPFMEKNGLGVVGSWSRRFGTSETLHKFCTDNERLKAGLLFSTPFCNPSTVMDRDRFGKMPEYEPEFDFAEDYHYWVKIRSMVNYGNIPRVLLRWRMHNRNVGTERVTAVIQEELSGKIKQLLLDAYGIQPSSIQRKVFGKRFRSQILTLEESRSFLEFLVMVLTVPTERILASSEAVSSVLSENWNLSCQLSAWSEPGIPKLWAEGCLKLGVKADFKTFSKMAMKRLRSRLGYRYPSP